jgi:hypothetical protein
MGARAPGEVVWTTLGFPVLVSEKMVELLRSAGASGWSAVPLQLYDKKNQHVGSHHYVCIHGRCGPLDEDRSAQLPRIYPGGVFPILRGLYFDPATWDGSDIFVPGKTAFILVVDRVKEVFEQADVKNVTFTPLDEVERRASGPKGE